MQKIMNRTTWLVVGLLAAATAGPIAAVDKGDAAPPWQARDFAGHTVDFPAVAEGKPTVVVFWATWCPYCRAFMPYLKNIQADYAQYGVKVVAINAKEDGRGDPQAYVQGLGFAPIAITHGDEIAKAYGIQYIPGLLIVDGKGMVAYRRPWTDLPAGKTVAELWDAQVRGQLDGLVHR
jgi:cytochrome c biogenesis protein CcmG/thiol:disulfide interchange protein DsbE